MFATEKSLLVVFFFAVPGIKLGKTLASQSSNVVLMLVNTILLFRVRSGQGRG